MKKRTSLGGAKAIALEMAQEVIRRIIGTCAQTIEIDIEPLSEVDEMVTDRRGINRIVGYWIKTFTRTPLDSYKFAFRCFVANETIGSYSGWFPYRIEIGYASDKTKHTLIKGALREFRWIESTYFNDPIHDWIETSRLSIREIRDNLPFVLPAPSDP